MLQSDPIAQRPVPRVYGDILKVEVLPPRDNAQTGNLISPPIISPPIVNSAEIKPVSSAPNNQKVLATVIFADGRAQDLTEELIESQVPGYNSMSPPQRIDIKCRVLAEILKANRDKIQDIVILDPALESMGRLGNLKQSIAGLKPEEVDPQKIEMHLQAVLRLSDSNPDKYYILLAYVDFFLSSKLISIERAGELLKACLTHRPDEKLFQYALRAFATSLLQADKIKTGKAEELLKLCIAKNPDEPGFHLDLAYVYLNAEEWDKALAELGTCRLLIEKNNSSQLLVESYANLEKLIQSTRKKLDQIEILEKESAGAKFVRGLKFCLSMINPFAWIGLTINRLRHKKATKEQIGDLSKEFNKIQELAHKKIKALAKTQKTAEPLLMAAHAVFNNYFVLAAEIKTLEDGVVEPEVIEVLKKQAEDVWDKGVDLLEEAEAAAIDAKSFSELMKVYSYNGTLLNEMTKMEAEGKIGADKERNKDLSGLGADILDEAIDIAEDKKDLPSLLGIAKNSMFTGIYAHQAFESAIAITADKEGLRKLALKIIEEANKHDTYSSESWAFRNLMRDLAVKALNKAGDKDPGVELKSKLSKKKVTEIEIDGELITREETILKFLGAAGGIKAGQDFDPERIEKAGLYLMHHLKVVGVTGWEVKETEDGLKLKIKVEDYPNISVGAGGLVGVGIEKYNVSGMVGHNNIAGTGQSARLTAGWDRTAGHDDFIGSAAYFNPYLFSIGDYPINLGLNVHREIYPVYLEEKDKFMAGRVMGGSATIGMPISERWSVFLTPAYDHVSNLDSGDSFNKESITPGVEYNSTNNPQIPTEGTVARLGVTYGYYGEQYLKPGLEVKQYFRLPADMSLAFRSYSGVGFNLWEGDRTYLGGQPGIIRGYKSPFAIADSFSALSGELRAPVIKAASWFKIQFYIFGDVGAGFSGKRPTLGFSTGVGVRFYLPILGVVNLWVSPPFTSTHSIFGFGLGDMTWY